MSHAQRADYMQEVSFAPESWGWKPEFHAAWAAFSGAPGTAGDAPPEVARSVRRNPLLPARVTGREHHVYEILVPDFSGRPGFETLSERGVASGFHAGVRVSGRFEYGAAERSDFPAPGDWVLVDPEEGTLRIHGVLDRRSSLSRAAAGPTTEEQVLAANIDTLFLVFALDGGRNFLARLLERSLFVARNSGASPCIVLNKADLATPEAREEALAEAGRLAPAVPVVALSAKTGEGIPELAALLSPGETVGMLGKSGVGKSALVNALASLGRTPAAGLAGGEANGADPGAVPAGGAGTGENGSASGDGHATGGGQPTGDGAERRVLAREGRVREDDRQGRHTTTSSRLFRLDSGLLLIDSPGIRELKIWGDAEGLEEGFPEIAELTARCRFADCSHGNEPGCAVREALDSGELAEGRFDAWKALLREQAFVERRTDERARREEAEKWKRIAKYQKELKKSRR